MSNLRIAYCPFYVTHNESGRRDHSTITCESIVKNLGFEARNQLRFQTVYELRDYMDLFCCGEWCVNCEYYKLIDLKYKGDEDGKEKK